METTDDAETATVSACRPRGPGLLARDSGKRLLHLGMAEDLLGRRHMEFLRCTNVV